MGIVLAHVQSLDSFLHVGCLVCRFPRVPCLCGCVDILPLFRGLQVRARFQHRVFHDEEEGRFRDRVINRPALGFILGGLECVYVLEDTFAVRVILL